jgi:hypothetical protein
MPVQTQSLWAPRTRAVPEAFVDHCLGVVGQGQVNAATRTAMTTSKDPLQVRELAIQHAGLSGQTGVIVTSLASQIQPYLGEHPALPAALLHGIYEAAGRVGLTDEEVAAQAGPVFAQVAPLLYEAKIRHLSRTTRADDVRHVRERMQVRGVPFDDPDFKAKLDVLIGAAPAGATVRQADPITPETIALRAEATSDDEFPDLLGCGGEQSAEQIMAVGMALYYRELTRYGANAAMRKLRELFESGQIDLCGGGRPLYEYVTDRSSRERDDELERIAELPFADGSIERMIAQVLGAALAMDRAEKHEQAATDAIFFDAVDDLRCAANEAGCGIQSYAAPDMQTQLSRALSILSSDEVDNAVRGAGCCSRSVMAVIEALTPELERPPRQEAAMRATVGRTVLSIIAQKPRTDWGCDIAQLAYREAALQQPGQAQVRELPRGGGARAPRNGSGIVRLRTGA